MSAASTPAASISERRRTADRIFRGALIFNTALTLFWGVMMVTQRDALIFHQYTVDRTTVASIFFSLLFFDVIWGYIWYGVKNALLKSFVGFSKEERRQALPAPWIALAVVISISNTALELFSPRGTDAFFMATGNALICLAFGIMMR